MKTLTITKGLPASGKSTWAREQQEKDKSIAVITKDDIRLLVPNKKKGEKLVLEIRDNLTIDYLNKGCSVIWADTNLNPIHENRAREIASEHNTKLIIKDFTDVSLEDCIKRDNARPNGVGESVIKEMYNQYLNPKAVPLKQDTALPKAIIVDIDNTLAIMGNRSPYNWSMVSIDTVNEPVKRIVELYDGQIIFVSGRDSICQKDTFQWIQKHLPNTDFQLFMRPQGDVRKDSIVKKELFNNNIKDRYFIEFVLDDRNSVVEMWRNLGLTCLQVAEGNF